MFTPLVKYEITSALNSVFKHSIVKYSFPQTIMFYCAPEILFSFPGHTTQWLLCSILRNLRQMCILEVGSSFHSERFCLWLLTLIMAVM